MCIKNIYQIKIHEGSQCTQFTANQLTLAWQLNSKNFMPWLIYGQKKCSIKFHVTEKLTEKNSEVVFQKQLLLTRSIIQLCRPIHVSVHSFSFVVRQQLASLLQYLGWCHFSAARATQHVGDHVSNRRSTSTAEPTERGLTTRAHSTRGTLAATTSEVTEPLTDLGEPLGRADGDASCSDSRHTHCQQ